MANHPQDPYETQVQGAPPPAPQPPQAPRPAPPPPPHVVLWERYEGYLQDVRGLSASARYH
ncbi:MAG: hypothetical protein KA419_13430, partial [Acidobacteria bacterium]|nr:hypothetical protein [Acidobacteriota bacterium]